MKIERRATSALGRDKSSDRDPASARRLVVCALERRKPSPHTLHPPPLARVVRAGLVRAFLYLSICLSIYLDNVATVRPTDGPAQGLGKSAQGSGSFTAVGS